MAGRAVALGADRLIVLTDVDRVWFHYGRPGARAVDRTTPDELARHEFEPGTMGPKVAAVTHFVRATGRPAAIGALDDAAAVLAGTAGTAIVAD